MDKELKEKLAEILLDIYGSSTHGSWNHENCAEIFIDDLSKAGRIIVDEEKYVLNMQLANEYLRRIATKDISPGL